ncbi:MAG TPA: hypothetical protein VFR47_09215 [Anaerolineales bacterium]|nr:hypothetical protein [Anaerolineales bacterium]
MFGLDGFKVALLAGQDFCTETPARGTPDLFVNGMIFLEASHALHFGRYKTDAQLRLFRACTLAVFTPLGLNEGWIKIEEFTEGKLKTSNSLSSTFLDAAKYLIENGANELQFAHIPLFGDNE